jgi:hypothetical protein
LEFKHPSLNDSPLPLVLEEIMKTKPIEEIEKVFEAAQIAEDAAKSRACEAEEKAKPFVEKANTARKEAAAFKRVRKAAQEKLS